MSKILIHSGACHYISLYSTGNLHMYVDIISICLIIDGTLIVNLFKNQNVRILDYRYIFYAFVVLGQVGEFLVNSLFLS